MRHGLSLVIAATLLAPASVGAKESSAIPLPRTTKWELRYNDDSCQLLAGFGAGDERVIMALTREEPGDFFDLELYAKQLKYEGIEIPMELVLGANVPTTRTTGIAMTTSSTEKLPVVRLRLRIDGQNDRKHPESMPKITPEREAAVTEIGFRKPGGKKYVLQTGSLGAPFVAMRRCTTDLVKSWGYDPAVEAGLTRPATPSASPGSWLGTRDFPGKSLVQGHNGLVRFRLDVGPDGVPSACRILYRTNPDEFADLSCQLLMRRARFKPALDAEAKPVKSYYINTIRWVAGGW